MGPKVVKINHKDEISLKRNLLWKIQRNRPLIYKWEHVEFKWFWPPNDDSHGENDPDQNYWTDDNDEKIKKSILDKDLRLIENQRIDEIITDFFERFDVTTADAVKCRSGRMFVSCWNNSWRMTETGHFRILCACQWTIDKKFQQPFDMTIV